METAPTDRRDIYSTFLFEDGVNRNLASTQLGKHLRVSPREGKRIVRRFAKFGTQLSVQAPAHKKETCLHDLRDSLRSIRISSHWMTLSLGKFPSSAKFDECWNA